MIQLIRLAYFAILAIGVAFLISGLVSGSARLASAHETVGMLAGCGGYLFAIVGGQLAMMGSAGLNANRRTE